jgi:hypothetical protein
MLNSPKTKNTITPTSTVDISVPTVDSIATGNICLLKLPAFTCMLPANNKKLSITFISKL